MGANTGFFIIMVTLDNVFSFVMKQKDQMVPHLTCKRISGYNKSHAISLKLILFITQGADIFTAAAFISQSN